MDTIAFLGTGLIGGGMVDGFLARGAKPTVWNRTRAKAEPFAAKGAKVVDTPEEAVTGAARVHVALPDDVAVDAVLDRVAERVRVSGGVVVDHSTTSPDGARERADRMASRGVAFVHAPVFMSPQGCREAKGLMLASAPESVFVRVKDALSAMTGELWYLGPETHRAAAYKLFGNAMIVTICGGLADVFAMAGAQGISAGDAYSLFAKFKPAATIELRGAKMAKGDFAPSFTMAMARKDVGLMLGAAGDDFPLLAVLPALAARMDAIIAAGHGDEDLAAFAHFVK